MNSETSVPKMSKRVTFQGYSDDGVVFSDGGAEDEADCWNRSVRFLVGEFGRGVIVSLRYAEKWHDEASWTISVVPSAADERDVPSIPAGWSVTFENGDRPYAMVLVITCPEDTRVRRLAAAKRELAGHVPDLTVAGKVVDGMLSDAEDAEVSP